jgi:PPOX class probable F420-dependent enzyme
MASLEKIEAFLAEPRNVMVAGIRRDGTPHLSPNWFLWDGSLFYISTRKDRAKYPIFRRDPRVQLAVDDSLGYRTVLVPGTVEVREDLVAEQPRFQAIREKHNIAVASVEEDLKLLVDQHRVLLAITPDTPPTEWITWGLD